MPKDGDQQKCFHPDCRGTMTYRTNPRTDRSAEKPRTGDAIGSAPHPEHAGWICDADWHHHQFDRA